MKSLLQFDTDHIKDYVFATGALRDVRGGSALLDELNRHTMPNTVRSSAKGAGVVYALGGGGLFLVEQDDAEVARLAVERAYREATGDAASVTGAWVTVSAATDMGSDVSTELQRLAYALRRAKDSNPARVALLTHPLLRPCAACGVEYASETWNAGTREEERVCRGCRLKRDEDLRVKAVARRAPGQPSAARDFWAALAEKISTGEYRAEALERPDDFDGLARDSQPKGYLGLIYSDGDGMGQKLQRLRTLGNHRQFAHAVDDALRDAVVDAAIAHLQPSGSRPSLPFDVLLLGGDDLVMVTRAQSALETAMAVVEGFTRRTRSLPDGPLRTSACVVLAHARFPFAALRQLAEEGLRLAKKEAAARHRSGQAVETGLINFLVVSGSGHLGVANYMDSVLRAEPPSVAEALDRTLRPYAPAELRRLLDAIRALADVPRSRLQQLREACFLDRPAASLEARAALVRWREEGQRYVLINLVRSFAGKRHADFPWFDQGDRWRTPLVDLAELFDFVTPGESRASA